jgi:hypothetical protein
MKSKATNHKLTPRLENELSVSRHIPHDENATRIFHAVNPGDLIAAMGAIKKFYDVTKHKTIVSQSTATPAAYYPGAVHPTVNERGENICCNKYMWQMLKPLIESQYYVHEFEEYEGQRIDLDFNIIRGNNKFVNLPHGAIQCWLPLAFPDLSFDISQPWMTLEGKCPTNIKKQVAGKVLLNFTERYRNSVIDYFFLKNYTDDLIFAGTEREHYLFCNRWNLGVPRLEIKDFLELAWAIKESRFLLANQSMNWNIAEALKTPRLLEICSYAQNCIHGVGAESYGFLHQVGAEHLFRMLYNKTSNAKRNTNK